MRFNPMRRAGPYVDTQRKRAAAIRSQRLEREALPLFADMIAAGQQDIETVMAKRATAWDEWQQNFRDARAKKWRKARRRLFELGDNVRLTVRQLWKEAPYPGSPEYLLDLMHGIETGRVDLECPPWRAKLAPLRPVNLDAIRAEARARMAGRAA